MPSYECELEDEELVSELEKEYKEVVDKHQPEIKRLMKQAKALIAEAVKLSEQHSIPFKGNTEDYIPGSLSVSKFDDLGWENIYTILGERVRPGYDSDDYGWMNSSSSC